MSMNSEELREAMQRMRITPQILELRFKRPSEIITSWIDGTRSPPPYILLAMEALTKGIEAADAPTMRKFASEIGADPANVKYWCETGQFPIIARYAVGMLTYVPSITESDREALYNMSQYRYSFLNGQAVARPVLGKVLPRHSRGTCSRLLKAGLIRNSLNKCLVTPKGKAMLRAWIG